MKKLLLALVLLLFLSAGAGAAWWFLIRGEQAEVAAGPGSASPTKPVYLDLDQMAVPVIRNDGTVRTFVLDLSLEVPEDAADKVSELMPRLHDGILVTLNELLGRRFMEERNYDQDLIRRHLLRVAREVAGQERIGAVLVRAMERHDRG